MKVAISMAGEAQRRQTGFGGVDAEFLAQLADQGRLRRFPGLDLAARKLSQSRHLLSGGPARQQNPPVGIDQGDGTDDHDRQAAAVFASSGSRH